MAGCLLAPFRALGCLAVVGLVAAGWLYRDRMIETVGRAVHEGNAAQEVGRPGRRALAAARARTDSVAKGRADSVVLSAAETASLIGDGLEPAVRNQLDSLEVRLLDSEIAVGAGLATARLPRELLGPLALVVRDRERIQATGPVRVVGPARGEWTIQRLSVRGFPLPRDLVPSVLARALGRGSRALPVAIPAGVREIRIHPWGAVLFGARKR